ncbi:hypothetical protein D3C76_1610440 [compost metagenome]
MMFLIFGMASWLSTRYAPAKCGSGRIMPFHGTELLAMASDSAQKALRQAITSPSCDCTPWKVCAPVISRARL